MIDEHFFDDMRRALGRGVDRPRPQAVLADPAKGKDVSFIEDQAAPHSHAPSMGETVRARSEIGK